MKMDLKQKILTVLTLAAFVFLGYQVYALVKQDISEPAVPSTVVSSESIATHTAAPASSSMKSLTSTVIQKTVSAQPQLEEKTGQKMAKEQRDYLNLVSQLELAKMKRQLLQEQVAIAQAQNSIAKLHQENSQLNGGRPAPTDLNTSVNAQPSDYQLSYIDRQNGQWSATLNFSGDYEQVQLNSQLPDGFTVLSIDSDGVTMGRSDQRKRVTFAGTIKLPSVIPKNSSTQMASQSAINANQVNSVPSQTHLQSTATLSQASALLKRTPVVTSGDIEKTLNHFREQELGILHLYPHSPMPSAMKSQTTLRTNTEEKENTRAQLVAKTTTTSKTKKYTYLKPDAKRVLKMNAQGYTIQLIGSHYMKAMQDYIKHNHLTEKQVTLYSLRDHKKEWHALIYGEYASIPQAQRVLKHMSKKMKDQGPWIRRISTIQKQILRSQAPGVIHEHLE